MNTPSNAELRHDLRAAINAIIGYSEILLEDSAPSSDSEPQIELILGAGRHLDALVGQLLANDKSVTAESIDEFRRIIGEIVHACHSLDGLDAERCPDIERIRSAALLFAVTLDAGVRRRATE